MFQKIAAGVLVLTLIGAGGSGLYDSMKRSQASTVTPQVASSSTPVQVAQAATPVVAPAKQGNAAQTGTNSAVGSPWNASGTIMGLDDTGMTLKLNDNSQIYVELGPSTYWKVQTVQLKVGDTIKVDGFANGDQFHAATVILNDNSKLVVRTADGKPMWAGNSGGAQGQASGAQAQGNGGQGGGSQASGTQTSGTQQAQVSPDAWVTLTGTVTSVSSNKLTVKTQENGDLAVSLGSANFAQSQGVTFKQGDNVKLLGFWQGTQFQAGEITNLTTGQRLMLRDPNGRPLWAGPGRNGNSGSSGGQSNGGQGGGQGNGGQGNGNGNGGQGNGKGGQGNGNSNGNG